MTKARLKWEVHRDCRGTHLHQEGKNPRRMAGLGGEQRTISRRKLNRNTDDCWPVSTFVPDPTHNIGRELPPVIGMSTQTGDELNRRRFMR